MLITKASDKSDGGADVSQESSQYGFILAELLRTRLIYASEHDWLRDRTNNKSRTGTHCQQEEDYVLYC